MKEEKKDLYIKAIILSSVGKRDDLHIRTGIWNDLSEEIFSKRQWHQPEWPHREEWGDLPT